MVVFALAPFACAHVAPREASAEAPRPDGALPPPPASRRGVTVPSDLGFGTGPAGPSTNGATPPTAPTPSVPNGT
jgi:hypothetical protein